MSDVPDTEQAGTGAVPEPAPRSRLAAVIAIPVFIVLAAFVFVLATSDSGEARGTYSALIGRQAPAVVGDTIVDGQHYDLADDRGRFVLVNFFATWCVPCIREHPDLVNFAQRHALAGDATVVSVVYDSRPGQVRDFFAAQGGDWPVVLDPDGRIALAYGVSGVPESYLLAPDGTVVVKLVGGVTASELDELLAEVSGS